MECNTKEEKEWADIEETGFVFDIGSLYSYLIKLKDSRKKQGLRYSLATILVLMILAKLSGQDKPSGIADWAQNRSEQLANALELERKQMPHHSTYRRVLGECIDEDEFEQIVSDFWVQQPEVGKSMVISIDGKTLRGTITLDDPFGLHLLAAYLPDEGIVLMQMQVEKDKENEIVVAPQLLTCLDLRNKVVVGDAMHTQRNLSAQIVEAEGDYVWIVKDNQPKTRQAIEQLFAPEKPVPGLGCPPMDFKMAETFDIGHGRIEERTITVSSMLNDYLDWPYLGQVFKLKRKFTYPSTGRVWQEVRYGITSLSLEKATPELLLYIIRSEWGIENGLHYRRDVTFQEDATRMTKISFARVMAIINNLVNGLLSHNGFRNFAQARRFYDAHPLQALHAVCRL